MTRHCKVFGVALAALFPVSGAVAFGQYTGVSHPDQTLITTAPATPAYANPAPPPQQPVQAATAAPVAPYASTPPNTAPGVGQTARVQPQDPDAEVVGDSSGHYTPPQAQQPDDPNEGVVVRVAGPAHRLPEGTLVRARLLQSLSTKATQLGMPWSAELTEPLTRDGEILIPAGSVVSGKVTQVVEGKRLGARAEIHLTTLAIALPDGSTRGFHAQLIDISLTGGVKVDSEGTILHKGDRKQEAAVLGLTAGGGAVVGGLVAGVPGALVGAGVGAGVSGVVWLKQDKQAELPKDTQLVFELTRSLGFEERTQ
jgi:hypothetical protein